MAAGHMYSIAQAGPGLLSEADFYLMRDSLAGLPPVVVGQVHGHYLARHLVDELNSPLSIRICNALGWSENRRPVEIADRVQLMADLIEQQECRCTEEGIEGDVCPRCRALGRYRDKAVF